MKKYLLLVLISLILCGAHATLGMEPTSRRLRRDSSHAIAPKEQRRMEQTAQKRLKFEDEETQNHANFFAAMLQHSIATEDSTLLDGTIESITAPQRASYALSALIKAGTLGKPSIIDHIEKTYNISLATYDQDAVSVLHAAALHDQLETVKYLVEIKEMYINFCPEKRGTPLHSAALGNAFSVAKYLVSKGASPLMWNKNKKTPIQLALKPSPKIAEYLQMHRDDDTEDQLR